VREDKLEGGAAHVSAKCSESQPRAGACCSLASFSAAIVPTARSETAQETAIGPDAADALARMGKTLSAKQFSFQSRTFRSYAGPNGELLHIAHTTKTVYDRPDRLSVSVTGDDGSVKIRYDGKTLVLYAADAKQYVSVPVTGSMKRCWTFSRSALERIIHSPIC